MTGKVVLNEYNYREPTTSLQVESQLNAEMPGMYYEYGDHYADSGEGVVWRRCATRRSSVVAG